MTINEVADGATPIRRKAWPAHMAIVWEDEGWHRLWRRMDGSFSRDKGDDYDDIELWPNSLTADDWERVGE